MFLNVFPSSTLFYSNTYFHLADGPPKGSKWTEGAKKIIEVAENSLSEKRNILIPHLGANVDKCFHKNYKTMVPMVEISSAQGTYTVFSCLLHVNF